MHHESNHGMPPPNFVTISCLGPGQLTISAQGEIYLNLRNGTIIEPSRDALTSGSVADFLSLPPHVSIVTW